MILLIDNYDSFVYNLARYLAELGCETRVVRNDALAVKDIVALRPAAIVLSPGPGTPRESGVSLDVVRELGSAVPILGVCLGHQAIAYVYGANVVRAPEPMHGRTSRIHHEPTALFDGLPNPLTATRYHSLIVEEESLPPDLAVTARSDDGLVMAIEHRRCPLVGVQFHPESVLTIGGHTLLGNFLTLAGVSWRAATCDDFRPPLPADDFYTRTVSPDDPSHGPNLALLPARRPLASR
jgi:anthranilate synthase/aminodeoxychorismate synthase-like glutamine amidotransferase